MIAGIISFEKNNPPQIVSSPLALEGSRWRPLQKNIPLVMICVFMLAVFAAVLWFSVDQIYQKEAGKQHGLTVARIENAAVIVKSLFADFSQDLKFVAKLKPFSLMTGNWQVAPVYLEQAGGILRSLLASHTAYKSVMVLGQHNRILIRITKDRVSERSEESVPFLYRDPAGRDHFEKNIARIPTGDLTGVLVGNATHLGEGVGELVLSVNLAGSLPGRELTLQLVVDMLAFIRLLPDNVFIQVDGIGLVEKTASGVLRKFETVRFSVYEPFAVSISCITVPRLVAGRQIGWQIGSWPTPTPWEPFSI